MRSAPKLGLLQQGHAASPVRWFGGATRLALLARPVHRFPAANGPRFAIDSWNPRLPIA